MSKPVSYRKIGAVAHIGVDDGKRNVMSPTTLRALHDALDQADHEVRAVLLTGRQGVFSAGFDLNVFARRDSAEIHEMMDLGSRLALRVFDFPLPVVTACTGHAFPMGAFIMLASDYCLGADGDFQIGMNEVAIGLTLPRFAVELARATLAPHYFNRIATGEMLSPGQAREAGYLDRVVAPDRLADEALKAAEALSVIDLRAHRETKARIRGAAIQAMRAAIEEDITLEHYQRAARGI